MRERHPCPRDTRAGPLAAKHGIASIGMNRQAFSAEGHDRLHAAHEWETIERTQKGNRSFPRIRLRGVQKQVALQ